MIKGSNFHVIPEEAGWCVISEANQKVINHFDTEEEARVYASQCAVEFEGGVLIHTTFSTEQHELSTVPLPQQENLPDVAHAQPQHIRHQRQAWPASGNAQSTNAEIRSDAALEVETGFDPLLGYDSYYFDI